MIVSVKTIYTITVDQVFQNFMFFFPRKERESFVRKVTGFRGVFVVQGGFKSS